MEAGQGHTYGEKWDYINDWVCLGGYSGVIGDNATGWTESDIYLYPAVDTTHGNVFAYGGKNPGRVQTGDCNNANKLDWKGNAASYGNCDNCYSYGFAWMYSPSGAGPKFLIGADDDQKTWVNGTLISSGTSCCNRDNFETGGIGMPAGWSRILFKVRNGTSGFNGTVSLRNGTDRGWNEGSVTRYSSSYGLGYEQDAWYPRIDVASCYGANNPQPNDNVYGSSTTVTASGTASVTGSVPLWKVMHWEWGYGISEGNYADVSSGTTSWSHTQTGVTGHRRFHFFSVSKSGRTSRQNSGVSGGDIWADGGAGNYVDVYVDNVAPQNPSFSSVTAVSTSEIDMGWSIPSDLGVGVAAGSSEYASEGGDNAYRRGDVGVQVYRGGSAIYTWNTGTSKNDTGLSSNTQYTYTIEARDNTGQSRGSWANSTGQQGSTAKYTLQNAATTPTVVANSTSQLTVTTTGPVNLSAGQSGVIFKRDGTTDLTKANALSKPDTGLGANTSHTYTARGVNGDGLATSESSSSAGKYTLIENPASLTASVVSTTQIDANIEGTFSNLNVASSGRYIANTTAGTNSDWSSGSTTVSWSSTGLDANTSYHFSAKVRNGDTAESTTVSADRYTLQNIAATPEFSNVTTTGFRVSTTGPVNLTAGQSGVVFHDGTADRTMVTQLYEDVTGLSPNTQYTFKAKGVNGEGTATDYSSTASTWTLSAAPSTGDVTPESATACTTDTNVTWTNNLGFGGGGVQYFAYAWDTSATHTWTGSETQWSSSTLDLEAGSPGTWYLHVKGHNGADVANGSFNYAVTVSAPPSIDRPVSPSLKDLCNGGSVEVTVQNAENGVTYQLYSGGNPTGSPGQGTGGNLVLYSDAVTGDTTVTVKATRLPCSTETLSGSTAVLVNTDVPTISDPPPADHNTVAGPGQNAEFHVNVSRATAYQWERDDHGDSNWTPVADQVGKVEGATTATLHVLNVAETDSGRYRCIASNSCPGDCPSVAAELTIAPQAKTNGWSSSRTQGGTSYSLPMPVSGTAAVEPRKNGIKKVVIEFDYPVKAKDGTLDVGDVSALDNNNDPVTVSSVNFQGDPPPTSGTKLDINFASGVADQKRYTIEARKRSGTKPNYSYADSFVRANYWSDNAILADASTRTCEVTCLVGDVNGDRTVDSTDWGAIKSLNRKSAAGNNGPPPPWTSPNWPYDINTDGSINIIDVALAYSCQNHEAP